MTFLGLPLPVLGALFAAAAAVTTLLYILKLRRRTIAVAVSPLWERLLRDHESSELFARLKRWLSLLLQLCLVGLLVLALGDPRWATRTDEGRQIVVLVDASASMMSGDVAPSRLAVAQHKLRELVQGLSGKDRVLLAQMATVTSPLSAMTNDPGVLGDAIGALEAQDTPLDLGAGLRFAAHVLHGSAHPQILIVSDGAFSDAALETEALSGLDVRFLAVGAESGNVGFTAFSVRRYPLDASRHEVMLELTNTGTTEARIELKLEGDGNPLEVSELSLGPGERLPRFYQNISGADRTLVASLSSLGETKNFLAADDQAYAVLPERQRVRVLVVSAGNTYLEAALLLDEYLEVSEFAPGAVVPPGDFDVSIFDGVAPLLEKRFGAVLYLNPPEGRGPVPVKRALRDFGFDTWDKKSHVLRFIAPENIQIAQGFALAPSAGDHVIGSSELGPILVEGSRGGQRFIQTGFDPRHSDFVLRVAWPLFVLNVINHFVEAETGYVASYQTGQVWRIPVPAGTTMAEIKGPADLSASVPIQEGRAVFSGTRAGFYELVAAGEGTSHIIRLAANLNDVDESRITPRAELKTPKLEARAPEPFEPGIREELWTYLLALVLVVSAVEWFTYHRRITV